MQIEDRLLGVQRARADVSEDNPESTNRESQLPSSAPVHAPQYSPFPMASKDDLRQTPYAAGPGEGAPPLATRPNFPAHHHSNRQRLTAHVDGH
jgi:hypothetical protein